MFENSLTDGNDAPLDIQDVVAYRSQLYVPDSVAKEVDDKPSQLAGSLVAFTVNGTPQGIAYRLNSRLMHCLMQPQRLVACGVG